MSRLPSSDSGSKVSFNLVSEPWIPVLTSTGRFERVGIWKALTEAGLIRQIAASNPMDNVALLRFLLAVLMWCRPGPEPEDCRSLDGADGLPDKWLVPRLGTVAEPAPLFDLLGSKERFFQDQKVKDNARPVGDLLVEFPTETKVWHFRHVQDREYGLCPACCSMGIVRFCSFANAYGGGRYTSAVNGPSPAFSIAHGATLLDTLRLHWPRDGSLQGEPPWTRAEAPEALDLDLATVFAWRSRSLWLGDPHLEGRCAYCGQCGTLITQLAFTGNWKPPFGATGTLKKFWEADPHLIIVDRSDEVDGAGEAIADSDEDATGAVASRQTTTLPQRTTLGFPSPGSRVANHARFWRRALAAMSDQVQDDAVAMSRSILVAGPAANKGLYQDATSLRIHECPSARALGILDKSTRTLGGILRSSTPNPDRQHPNRLAALDAMSPSLEAGLRRDLGAGARGGEAIVEAADLRDRLSPVLVHVVRSTTSGSQLRRRAAMARAASALSQVLTRAIATPTPARAGGASADGAGRRATKPARGRKDKGAAS